MNTQQLLGWMNDPAALGKEAGAQLESLTQQFPYFQTAHLLLIKSLHNQNSFLYNNQLKVAAAYATNRRILYELITKKVSGSEFRVSSSEVVQEAKSSIDRQETVSTKEPETRNPKLETTNPEPETVIQPEFPKKRFVSSPDEWESGMMRQLQLLHHWKQNPGEVQPVEKTPVEKTPVEKTEPEKMEAPVTQPEIQPEEKPTAADEINTLLYVLVEPGGAEDVAETEEVAEATETENAANNEAPAEWEVTPVETEEKTVAREPVDVPEDPVQQEIIREAISSFIELEVDDTLPTPDELRPSVKPVPEKEKVKPVLEEKTTEKTAPAEKISEEPVKIEASVKEEIAETSFSAWLQQVGKTKEPEPEPEPVAEPVAEKKEATPALSNDLIDNFIQKQPRIQSQKNTFYSPVNMAKKSVQESDEFITETLARIYVKQGNIAKAIRAYQKLSLKFPEKTTYFAALIEELKRTPK